MALARKPLPEAVFEAIASSPEEAEALAYKDRKKRHLAEARALVRW